MCFSFAYPDSFQSNIHLDNISVHWLKRYTHRDDLRHFCSTTFRLTQSERERERERVRYSSTWEIHNPMEKNLSRRRKSNDGEIGFSDRLSFFSLFYFISFHSLFSPFSLFHQAERNNTGVRARARAKVSVRHVYRENGYATDSRAVPACLL